MERCVATSYHELTDTNVSVTYRTLLYNNFILKTFVISNPIISFEDFLVTYSNAGVIVQMFRLPFQLQTKRWKGGKDIGRSTHDRASKSRVVDGVRSTSQGGPTPKGRCRRLTPLPVLSLRRHSFPRCSVCSFYLHICEVDQMLLLHCKEIPRRQK